MISSFSFSDNTVGYILSGEVNQKTIDRMIKQIEDKWERFDQINLYLEDDNVEEFTLGAIVKEFQFKLSNAEKFEKIALVTNRKWIKACSALKNMLVSAEMRAFDTENRLEALSWVGY
ncbi:MAG: STAS/SEC14 domain-containing protein [Dokdonia sp.]|jgi:hypothetical protein|nr:hypothetical protein [Cytophagaceae bacterium]|tara:strand:- start:172 stop:525 length:354 start_codon:yes stop_codon:yes gene_type:complete